jgi:hypothetical protein
VTRYTVILDIVRRGVSIGSTCDTVDADTSHEAETAAASAWKRLRPDCTFRPLLVTDVRACTGRPETRPTTDR